GEHRGLLVEAGDVRDVGDELVMAEPALVIEDFLPALRTARGGLAEFEDLERTLIVVFRSRRLLLRRCLCGDRACHGHGQCNGGQHPRCGCHAASLYATLLVQAAVVQSIAILRWSRRLAQVAAREKSSADYQARSFTALEAAM